MGIFGYLSKAHLDQNIISGDVQARITLVDEKIKTERDNIEAARRALAQMDAQVDQVLGRTDDARGAERAVQIRRNQARERTALQNEIAKSQAAIAKLNEEAAPIRAEVRKIEAEVGPIKYIAKLIYGDNPDANLLEKAVTWVIIIIVLVFDPLAVVLLLSSQYSFQWCRQQKEEEKDNPEEFFEKAREIAQRLDKDAVDEIKSEKQESNDPSPPGWMFPKHASIIEHAVEEEKNVESELAIDDDQEILDSAIETEKQAMQAWKHDNPDSSLKLQKRLLERGAIKELPWMSYLQPKADYTEEQEAALEAAKWAHEQLGNNEQITWMENENGQQVKKSTYQQNAEQNERTIWQRIQDAKK